MKRYLHIAVLACAAAVPAAAQQAPEIKYEANADVITLPAYGEVAGVATNSRGHVFIYARTGHPVATLGTSAPSITATHGSSSSIRTASS